MKNKLANTYTEKVFVFLFGDRRFEVKDTLIGKIFKRIYFPYLTEVFLFLAVIIYWYEGYLAKYWSFLNNDWLALCLVLLALLFANKEKLVFHKAQVWYLVFLIVFSLSGLLAINHGLNSMMVFKGWLLFAQFGLVFYAASSLSAKKMMAYLLILSLPISIVGIHQFLTNLPTSSLWLSPGEARLTRAFAFFGSPNVLGVLMAIMAILGLGQYLKNKKIVYLIPAGLSLLATLFTFSRSAWLGLVVALIFGVFLFNYRWLIYAPIMLFTLFVPQIRNRLESSLSEKYLLASSLDGRRWAITNGLYIFKKHLFSGAGPGSYGGKLAASYGSPTYLEGIQNGYTALYYTDNQFLEILVQGGIFGVLSFAGFVVSAFVTLIGNYDKEKNVIILTTLAAFTCFLVSGFFANVLEYGALAVPMGLILGSGLNEG